MQSSRILPSLNLHSHLHFLVVFEGGSDREGRFHGVCRFNDDLLREIFTREVFSLLLRKQLINLTLIQKIEVDPLLCPACGGQMSLISFIEDHKVIDRIIDHLKLPFMAERPSPSQIVQQELLMAAEEKGT